MASGNELNRKRKKTPKKDKFAVTITQVNGVKVFTTKDGEQFKTVNEARSHLNPDWDKG